MGAMQGGFGAMQQGMGLGPSAGGAGGRPTVRNPLMTFLIPILLMTVMPGIFTGIASATDIGAIALLGSLCSLAGAVLSLVSIIKMTNELKAVTGNAGFAWWPIFIPIYSIYWAWILVPQEMAKAKQMRGVQNPPRGIVVYIFLFLYAMAADLNDIAKAP